jgi:L-rhamnose mutarotase
MTRMGMCIRVVPDQISRYKALHAAVWPAVLERISACQIRNYSIFLNEPEHLLFGYWEYHGSDFAADMARMAADPATQEWWALCTPCQQPFDTRAPGEWWSLMQQVFHCS